MKPLHPIAAIAACALLLADAQATELLVNGSFESPQVSYSRYGAGSTAITGWTTVLSGVEAFSPSALGFGAAADGLMVVDLANYTFSAGGLEQTVATVPGQAYDVGFFAGNSLSSGRTGTGIVKVTIDGTTTLQFDTAVATSATLAWAARSFSFVATDDATTIRFWNDQNANQYFALLDGVGVTAAVPEPATWALLGVGAALLLSRTQRRRG
jgi:hypothetical protein